MKNIFKIMLVVLVLIGTTTSCTEGDNAIDQLFDNVDRSGAIIRTLSPPLDFLINSNPDMNFIDISIEVQEANGDAAPDFKEVRVYIGVYGDQLALEPLVDDQGVASSEKVIMTLLPGDFSTGDNGLPVYDIAFLTQDVVDLFPNEIYTAPTFIEVRLELEMSDGRVFSKENVAATIATGVYFYSPFSYILIFMNF